MSSPSHSKLTFKDILQYLHLELNSLETSISEASWPESITKSAENQLDIIRGEIEKNKYNIHRKFDDILEQIEHFKQLNLHLMSELAALDTMVTKESWPEEIKKDAKAQLETIRNNIENNSQDLYAKLDDTIEQIEYFKLISIPKNTILAKFESIAAEIKNKDWSPHFKDLASKQMSRFKSKILTEDQVTSLDLENTLKDITRHSDRILHRFDNVSNETIQSNLSRQKDASMASGIEITEQQGEPTTKPKTP